MYEQEIQDRLDEELNKNVGQAAPDKNFICQTTTPHPTLPIRGGRKYVVAFTLAEVLITLVIIGIIAAITVPIMVNNHKWAQYRSGAIKAKNILDNAMLKYREKEGENPLCGVWGKNPYSSYQVCAQYNDKNVCTKWTLPNGNPLPSDYYGPLTDCRKVYNFLIKNLNVVKFCNTNAYAGGCIPDYDGVDTIYKNKYSNKNDDEVAVATQNHAFFVKNNIKTGDAIVLSDGMILVPQSAFWGSPTMVVDVNGQKGPNKWGHDIVIFRGKMTNRNSVPQFDPLSDSMFVDKGGMTTYKLIYGKK